MKSLIPVMLVLVLAGCASAGTGGSTQSALSAFPGDRPDIQAPNQWSGPKTWDPRLNETPQ